jgi:hypothetical protein
LVVGLAAAFFVVFFAVAMDYITSLLVGVQKTSDSAELKACRAVRWRRVVMPSDSVGISSGVFVKFVRTIRARSP